MFRMAKKIKIITIGSAIFASLIAIACAALGNDKNSAFNGVHVTPQSTTKWAKKAPQLFNNVKYSKLIESNIHLSESQAELVGTITNPFGIRDDILEYIIANVPSEPQYALKAAITLARNEQVIYYGKISESQALQLANENSLILICLLKYLGNDKWDSLTKNTEALLRNTKARDKHMCAIDTKVFGWKIIGSGLNGAEIEKACEKGDF